MSNKREIVEASGSEALLKFKRDLAELGLKLPEDYSFRAVDKPTLQLINSAVFFKLGGIDAMTAWAFANPNEFYKVFMKLDAAQNTTNIGIQGNGITITTGLPSTNLDTIELDSEGRIIDDGDDAL